MEMAGIEPAGADNSQQQVKPPHYLLLSFALRAS